MKTIIKIGEWISYILTGAVIAFLLYAWIYSCFIYKI
jgi:hypothetical protein